MGALRLDRLLDFLTSMEFVVGLLWVGLAVFTVAVLVLMRTRWGQSRSLRKCMVLSVLAHLLLAGYATTVQIVSATPLSEEPVLKVSFVEALTEQDADADEPPSEPKPWEDLVHDHVPQPIPFDPQRAPPDPAPDPQRRVQTQHANLPGGPPLDYPPAAENTPPEPQPREMEVPTGRPLPGKCHKATPW